MPKVSVIMGVYNSEKVVGRAIESILNQSYKDFEFIICDDKSTDSTLQVISKYCAQDKRIKLICNSFNVGLAETLNNCINISDGELIARMDDDDISHYDRLEKQVAFMDKHPEYTIVGTGKRSFDENGIWEVSVVEGERSLEDIFKGNTFYHPTVMMRKKALEDVGWYTVSPLTRRGQDYDLWCKFYYQGYKGINMKDILFDYYESKESVKRRKLKFRISVFRNKIFWRKKLRLPLIYIIYAYKELLVGIIPKHILLYYKKRKQIQ